MGRPTIKINWASAEVNYPGGNPWSGQPILVTPLQDYFTPGATLPAEDLNYALHSATQAASDLNAFVGQADALNWPGGAIAYSTQGTRLWWDEQYGRWVCHGLNTAQMYASYDGLLFNALGAAAVHAIGRIQQGQSGGGIWAVALTSSGAGSNFFEFFTPSGFTGGSWGGAIPAPSDVIHVNDSMGGIYFNPGGGAFGTFIFAANQSGGATTYVYWATGSSFHGAATGTFPSSGNTRDNFHFATDGNKVLLFSKSDTGTYSSSTDGKAWTGNALPSLASGEAVIGAYYDADAALWRFVSSGGSGAGTTHVWSSPTGNAGSWTVTGTFTTRAVGSVAFNGSEMVGLISDGTYFSAAVSTDGGNTWCWCSRFPRLQTQVSNLGVIHATKMGFVFFDTSVCAISQCTGSGSAVAV